MFKPNADLAFTVQKSGGFTRDTRFAAAPARTPQGSPAPPAELSAEERAFNRGVIEGSEQARLEHDTATAARSERLTSLETAFTRLGEEDAASLRERIHQTVVALCEATLLPAALDHELLARRIEIAAAMLVRAHDQRRIKVCPQDFDLLQELVPPDLKLEADPAIEPGALRIDTDDGGVEDGPAIWRAKIEEALSEC